MGTTIEDIQYEEYLEGLHKFYINALEVFAKLNSLAELKNNLEELERARANLPDQMTQDTEQSYDLENVLNDISILEEVYRTLIQQKREAKIYFFAGLVIGSIVTILSSLLL